MKMEQTGNYFRSFAILALAAVLLTGCARVERRAAVDVTEPPTVMETVPEETGAAELPKKPDEQTVTQTLPDTPERDPEDRTAYNDVLTPMVSSQNKGAAPTSAVPENKRIRYDSGTCYRLEGNVYAVAIFLDDDVSSWPEEKVLTYLDQLVKPGLKFIEDNAAKWDVDLKIDLGYYASYGHPSGPIKYNGVIDSHNDSYYTKDILEQASVAIGFESKEDMHRRLQEHSGQDQVIYIVMLNKGGRSYSFSYNHEKSTTENRLNAMEYSMIYTGFTDDSGDTASDTIAHETLHMFGARDYYMPEGRKAFARELYPKASMLCDMPDLESFDPGAVTAYSVGWTDEIPEVLYNEAWWE